MAVSNAFSRSLAMDCWTREIIYSMKTASQGKVMGPLLGSPNSSSDILKSSLKMLLLRYGKGTTKRLSSELYTTKWPFSAVDDVLQLSASTSLLVLGNEILFLLMAAIFCHFLAILMSFLALIILFGCVKSRWETSRLKEKEVLDLRTLKWYCWAE